MLPIVLTVAALALLTSVVLLVVRSRAGAPVVEPEEASRPARVIAEAVPAPARISGEVERPRFAAPPTSGEALDTLDALLAELESATVRIDGADALDESAVATLEGLADRLEAAAASFAAR
jgi:hypothetical protein